MNRTFSEATTSTAFLLTLTKRQCNTLLRQAAHEAEFGKPEFGEGFADKERRGNFNKQSPAYIGIVDGDSYRGLRDRGLVFWFTDSKGQACGFGGMTKAGELVAGLLVEAGMTIENTNTLSVLRRLDRAA